VFIDGLFDLLSLNLKDIYDKFDQPSLTK
jgi:hypothetical protein